MMTDVFSIVVGVPRNMVPHSTGRPIACPIHVKTAGVCFPDAAWDDFAVVILLWWLRAAEKMQAGEARVTMLFMDGPFEIRVNRFQEKEECELLLVNRASGKTVAQCASTVERISTEISASARRLLGLLAQSGYWDSDCDALKRALADNNPAHATEPPGA